MVHSHLRHFLLCATVAVAAALAALGVAGRGPAAPSAGSHSAAFGSFSSGAPAMFGGSEEPGSSSWQ